MCGIAGIVSLRDSGSVDRFALKRMTDAIAHRGPDGEGQWCEKQVGLGHRRLSIIDLSNAAAQPMLSTDSRYVLTYNGELYNYRELRSELAQKGYVFYSSSDTEVVLNALIEWGAKALNLFNGMFAFAFWDKAERTLMIARDRYGIKPVYYTCSSDYVSFASEQKALYEAPGFVRQLNKKALLEYFTFQNIFTDQTLLENVNILPAGCYLELDLKKVNPVARKVEYWDFDFREPEQVASREEYQEELSRLFEQAVQRQLVTDVEIGSYLSGGIDSGSITGVAAASLPYMKSFTCGFDLSSASGLELAYDERAKAEYLSYQYKTEHYEMVLKAGDMERCLPKLAYHLEEPRVGQSYPNYYAAQLASKFVKVVLSGAGGDELFGGYPWRYYRAVVNSDFEEYIDKYYAFWQRLIPNTAIKEVFSPIKNEVDGVWTRDIFRDVFKHHSESLYTPEDYINHSLYFEAKTFLHGLLVVEDKLSMAHGLETRLPFLDNDLVDFAMKCPVSMKLNNLSDVIEFNENIPGDKTSQYYKKTKDGKQILRDAMDARVPEKVRGAEKQGFSAPDASWFQGDSIDFVKSKLLTGNPAIYQYLNRNKVEALIGEHLSGTNNRRLLIWSLLNVEEYLSENLS